MNKCIVDDASINKPDKEWCAHRVPEWKYTEAMRQIGDNWCCSRLKDHKGLHHAHDTKDLCHAKWTTEESLIEAL